MEFGFTATDAEMTDDAPPPLMFTLYSVCVVSLNLACVHASAHGKWVLPTTGTVNLDYSMLMLEYDPVDLWGTLTLDLSLPWEHLVAASLYHKARRRG